jgi:hypothetical protein
VRQAYRISLVLDEVSELVEIFLRLKKEKIKIRRKMKMKLTS